MFLRQRRAAVPPATSTVDIEADEHNFLNNWLNAAKNKFAALKRIRLVRYYAQLFSVLLFIYILQQLVPEDPYYELDGIEHALKYSKLQPIIEYDALMQNAPLRARYAKNARVLAVEYPRSVTELTSSLDAIRFTKELNALHHTLASLANDYEFTCVPALALGVELNILYVRSLKKLLVNPRVLNKRLFPTISQEKEEIFAEIKDVFDERVIVREIIEYVNVTYIDVSRSFQNITEEAFFGENAFCVTYYLENFFYYL